MDKGTMARQGLDGLKILALALFLCLGFAATAKAQGQAERGGAAMEAGKGIEQGKSLEQAKSAEICFAGGCFWGVQEYFRRIPGVISATAGYANGPEQKPNYESVCAGSGHAEAVLLRYDPKRVGLATLVRQFWRIIDPTSLNRQGNDRGIQYRSGIYYSNPAERPELSALMKLLGRGLGRPVAVELEPLKNFFPAEDYHQDYLRKNPGGYCHIDFRSLNKLPEDAALDPAHYATPEPDELKRRLAPEAWAVTRESATEPPFSGAYWQNKEPGIYVDAASGEPLFSSRDKFDSGTGWPSFSTPLAPLKELRDKSHGMERIEVRSQGANGHLGHVFPDGPKARGGLRYCINSAALRFIPCSELEREGYGQLKALCTEDAGK